MYYRIDSYHIKAYWKFRIKLAININANMGSIFSIYPSFYRNCLIYILEYSKMAYKVGEIQGHDVMYVPERNQIFCKNTAVNYSLIERIVRGNTMRETIPEKDLTITKDMGVVNLGCLTTTMENCLAIRQKVNKLKSKQNV